MLDVLRARGDWAVPADLEEDDEGGGGEEGMGANRKSSSASSARLHFWVRVSLSLRTCE